MLIRNDEVVCRNCMFYDAQLSNSLCRRYPPKLFVATMRTILNAQDMAGDMPPDTTDTPKFLANAWPQVQPTDVCGEWKADQETTQKLMRRAALAGGGNAPLG